MAAFAKSWRRKESIPLDFEDWQREAADASDLARLLNSPRRWS
jgi:hypothetical protein